MFGIAIVSEEQERHYWIGGEMWEAHPEEAVRFYSETNAEMTIDVLKKAFPDLSSTVQIVPLQDDA
jgi:hypothetical protein